MLLQNQGNACGSYKGKCTVRLGVILIKWTCIFWGDFLLSLPILYSGYCH